ncbi:MAG TPA: hypothetical protein VFN97_02275 [Actinospica sp.]|nr:hypothetical protein [Actinospica sp.]
MPPVDPTPYEVLSLPRDADASAVDAAVDAALADGRYAAEQVEEAGAVLRDPARRLELDVQHLLPPEPVDEAATLLTPASEARLPFPEPPAWSARELTALHRRELEAQFAELPAPPAGFPGVPERFGPDASVLPPFEPPR